MMFDLTILDYIYIFIVLASTIWATVRGGIYETVATISWVVAAITARFVSPWLDGVFQSWFGLTESTVGTLVTSYFLVFFVILVVFGFFNQRLRDKIQESVMNITDHTLGVIFGIVRGIVLMGVVYWVLLWYFSDGPHLPEWVSGARTRPVMQLTAIKLDKWFVPGSVSKLLQRDMTGSQESVKIYNNLINPAVKSDDESKVADGGDVKHLAADKKSDAPAADTDAEMGYKSSERAALENQLLQIETAARAQEQNNDTPEQ